MAEPTVTEFRVSGVWVVPANVHKVLVECWGAGAVGGFGGTLNPGGGGGGGGGGAYAASTLDVVPGIGYDIVVGEGGGNVVSPPELRNGGDSEFARPRLVGAAGGRAPLVPNQLHGGQGGFLPACLGQSIEEGQNGDDGDTNSQAAYGAQGGRAGGFGGLGGIGGAPGPNFGFDGSDPGGGGGGGGWLKDQTDPDPFVGEAGGGGSGGHGLVRLTFTPAQPVRGAGGAGAPGEVRLAWKEPRGDAGGAGADGLIQIEYNTVDVPIVGLSGAGVL